MRVVPGQISIMCLLCEGFMCTSPRQTGVPVGKRRYRKIGPWFGGLTILTCRYAAVTPGGIRRSASICATDPPVQKRIMSASN